VVVSGALDNLSDGQARALAKDGQYPLQTKLRSGAVLDIPADEIERLLAPAAAALVSQGADIIALACMGRFDGFVSPVPLLTPGTLLPDVVRSLFHPRAIGVVTPNQAQATVAKERWAREGFAVHSVAASPFREAEIINAAAMLRETDSSVVVLDCMGHGPAYRSEMARLCKKPVIAAQTVAARFAAQLAESVESTRHSATGASLTG
jgi:protein AroM